MIKKLNLGCGKIIKKGWTNVDIQKGKGIDKSFDFCKFPYPFKDNTFDVVLLDNVLEHLVNPQAVVAEIWRICKNKAIIEAIVPYYNSYYAYGDPTHVNFFNESSIQQTFGEVDYIHDSKGMFEILEINSVSQRFIRFLPEFALNAMKRVFSNIIVRLEVKAKVLK